MDERTFEKFPISYTLISPPWFLEALQLIPQIHNSFSRQTTLMWRMAANTSNMLRSSLRAPSQFSALPLKVFLSKENITHTSCWVTRETGLSFPRGARVCSAHCGNVGVSWGWDLCTVLALIKGSWTQGEHSAKADKSALLQQILMPGISPYLPSPAVSNTAAQQVTQCLRLQYKM